MISSVRNLFKFDAKFKFAVIVLGILAILAIVSLFNPYEVKSWNVVPRDLPPSLENPLGTNSMGQDIFWKATVAIRNSFLLGLIAAAISRTIAISIGLIAGYRGGILDRVLMTINDSFVIIPLFPLLILIASILKTQLNIVILGVILGVFGWAWDARLFRAQILSLREREFTKTAVLSGSKVVRIVFKEHLPFVIPLILAATMNNLLWAVGMEVTLAVLGLSSLEIPTLGTMIYWSISYQAMFMGLWNWILTPVIICVFLILSLYMLSVSVGRYLDPRTRLQMISYRKKG